jgi:RNA polymerase sigma factor (TIGR02999 family)
MSDVTQILHDMQNGNAATASKLLPLIYDELRKLAGSKMALEAPHQTLQATALVHEAYLRLVGPDQEIRWNSRGHFFGAAAEAMRRILVERARQRDSLKRGGQFDQVELSDIAAPEIDSSIDLLALNEALVEFEQQEPQKAELVKLRFFAGLSLEETADAMGISVASAKRYWAYSRAWLFGRIHQ